MSEFLDKREDLFTRRRNSRQVRTLIESIQDKVNWTLVEYREHVPKALHHHTDSGLRFAIIVRQIKPGKDVATMIRLSRELDEKGGKDISDILLVKIPKVKIKVCH